MEEKRCRASLIINTLAAALFHVGSVNLLLGHSLTESHRRRFSWPNVLCKVAMLRPQRKVIFIIAVTRLM